MIIRLYILPAYSLNLEAINSTVSSLVANCDSFIRIKSREKFRPSCVVSSFNFYFTKLDSSKYFPFEHSYKTIFDSDNNARKIYKF